MAIRKILLYPEQETLLRRPSQKVAKVDKRIRQLIEDLKETLADHGGGAGLAAPQIGVHLRVTIVQFGQDEDNIQPPVALINPEITATGELRPGFDGCLSIPGLATWDTPRPETLTISALDDRGQPIEMEVRGADARLVHHEIDHLDGILYLDRLEDLSQLYRRVRTAKGEKWVRLDSLK